MRAYSCGVIVIWSGVDIIKLKAKELSGAHRKKCNFDFHTNKVIKTTYLH